MRSARRASADPATLQREHFAKVADTYDSSISHGDDEHGLALRHISVLVDELAVNSVLDVGTGTGRGLKYFLAQHPGMHVHGIEPVPELIEQAVCKNGIPPERIAQGAGDSLPFADGEFDAVTAFGVLHHAENPSRVIKEMMRVARRAVFISDSNRFGQGSKLSRLAKIGLWNVGLWPVYNYIATKGKGYHVSEGDGLFYSYSVFDQYRMLAEWADRVVTIPLVHDRLFKSGVANPTLTATHILLCALKDEAVPTTRPARA
jgi:SAM-dependent methyltransferase